MLLTVKYLNSSVSLQGVLIFFLLFKAVPLLPLLKSSLQILATLKHILENYSHTIHSERWNKILKLKKKKKAALIR